MGSGKIKQVGLFVKIKKHTLCKKHSFSHGINVISMDISAFLKVILIDT